MRNEVVGIGALENQYLHRRVTFGVLNERKEVANQFRTLKIHRWCVDRREKNRTLTMDFQFSKTNSGLDWCVLIFGFSNYNETFADTAGRASTPSGITTALPVRCPCSKSSYACFTLLSG